MIGYLQGIIIQKEHDWCILLIGGIGYRVCVLERVFQSLALNAECALFISSYYREGAPELYGFFENDDRLLFEHLITVSGVGPKSALAVLRLASAADIRVAIARGDADLLKKVSGIGSKTAERIVVELKGILREWSGGDVVGAPGQQGNDLIDALMRLGYTRAASRDALSRIPESAQTPEEKIREALKHIL